MPKLITYKHGIAWFKCDLDEETIREKSRMTVKEINHMLPLSSRFPLREGELNGEYTKDDMLEYLLSLESYLEGLCYAKTKANDVTVDDACDAQINENAACYYVFNYLLKRKPPFTFSSKEKENSKSSLISILSKKAYKDEYNVDMVFDFPHLWENIPPYWKQYDEIIFAAFQGQLIQDPIPQKYPCLFDRHKIPKMLSMGIVEWKNLPNPIRSDTSFVQKVLQDTQPLRMHGKFWVFLMVNIFSERRELFLDRNLWIQTLLPTCKEAIQCMNEQDKRCEHEFKLIKLLAGLEPINVESEVMGLAIEINPAVFLILHENLKNDNHFIRDIMTKCPKLLFNISNERLLENKDLVTTELLKKLQSSKSYHSKYYLTSLASKFQKCGFWNDEEFTNKWFEQGFPLFPCQLPENWPEDKEKERLLNVARNCGRKDYVINSFRFASPALRNDIEFFRKAMQYNKYVICSASKELKENDMLVIDAIASSKSFTEFFKAYYDHDVEKYLLGLQSRLCTKLDSYDCFHTVLCLISHIQPWRLLNQDEDTSIGYKKRIAELLDVPFGKDLKLARRAYEHLNRTFQK